MKKEYEMPATTVVRVEMSALINSTNPNKVKMVDGNAGLKFGGSSANDTGGGARSRGGSDWDDE
jgi:hypothetical protein